MTAKLSLIDGSPVYEAEIKRTLEWIGIDDLEIHPSAQRAEKPVQISKIAQHYDVLKFGCVIVSRHTIRGRVHNYVTDGQQRVTACRRMERLDPVPCLVYHDISLKEDAGTAVGLNRDRTAWTSAEQFDKAVKAGEPDAVSVHRILSNLGVTVANNSSEQGLVAIAAVQKVHQTLGAPGLERVMRTLVHAWPTGQNGAWSTSMIGGTAIFWAAYPAADEEWLIRQLSRENASTLLGRAKAARENKVMGMTGDVPSVVAATIGGVYNEKKGRKSELLAYSAKDLRGLYQGVGQTAMLAANPSALDRLRTVPREGGRYVTIRKD